MEAAAVTAEAATVVATAEAATAVATAAAAATVLAPAVATAAALAPADPQTRLKKGWRICFKRGSDIGLAPRCTKFSCVGFSDGFSLSLNTCRNDRLMAGY